jgi:DNA-directed RNA polymerase subunit RPC12/RpoP
MRCHNCNNEISEMKNFCENCGARLLQTPDSNQCQETPVMSNGQLMGVLGLVFGVIGLLIFPVVFGARITSPHLLFLHLEIP